MFSKAIVPFLLLTAAVQALTPPGCQSSGAPAQKTLTNVSTAYTNTSRYTCGLAYAQPWQGNYAFVSLYNALGVLNTSNFPPNIVHEFFLPSAGAFNVDLSSNGKHLYIAAEYGAYVVDTALAIANGNSSAVIGFLNGTTATQHPGYEAFSVSVNADETYAFVAQEYGDAGNNVGNMDVFELQQNANGSVSGTPIGFQSLAQAVPYSTFAPGGQIMYAVSEGAIGNLSDGLLHVLDVSKLETDPSSALLGNVTAGCHPVRILPSSDGSVVWVTVREANHLIAFNSSLLLSDPDNALIVSVEVGTEPVALAFVKNETRILTADSNRQLSGNVSGISVVDVQAALSGSANAVLGRVPTGLFPRDIVLSPDGTTALVADYNSGQIQAIDVCSLP